MAFITAYWGLDGIIVLTTLIIIVYLYMTRKFNYWKKRNVVDITPTPFLGNFMDCVFLRKSAGSFMKDLYDQAKGLPYIGFFIFDKPCLLVRDREIVKNVLVKDFNYFADRYGSPDPNDRLGYANLFFLKNPDWKMLRTKLTPVFTSGKMKKMYELMIECVSNLETYLESLEVNVTKEVDMKDISAKFTTDIIGCIAYGLNVNSLNNPDAEFRKYGKMVFDFSYIRGFEMLAAFFLPNIARLAHLKTFGKDTSIFLRKAFWETMTHRMESGLKRNDLIDTLIELKKTYGHQDMGGFKFNGDDLLAQAALFFAAGFETSATILSFALYELALNPEIQNKLRKEILQTLVKFDGKITYEMIISLSYLDMVFSETLRMYPPVEYLQRITIETYNVPNYNLVFEKGTPIFISVRGLHYEPKYFPNPYKFDPERFNEENKFDRSPYVYIPFGEGPRACIGTRLGLLEMKLALVKMLSKFEVSPCEKTWIPMKLDLRATLTMPLENVIYLNIRKINTEKLQTM
ncbi:hypothetical protein ACFW04_005052 [Cataglyphis niger]